MDWAQFTFLIGSGVAVIMKQFWFKDDTRARDKAIPVIVFASNLLARLAQELEPAATVGGAAGMIMFGFIGWGLLDVVKNAVLDSLLSYGTHRGKRWVDNIRGWKPSRKK